MKISRKKLISILKWTLIIDLPMFIIGISLVFLLLYSIIVWKRFNFVLTVTGVGFTWYGGRVVLDIILNDVTTLVGKELHLKSCMRKVKYYQVSYIDSNDRVKNITFFDVKLTSKNNMNCKVGAIYYTRRSKYLIGYKTRTATIIANGDVINN